MNTTSRMLPNRGASDAGLKNHPCTNPIVRIRMKAPQTRIRSQKRRFSADLVSKALMGLLQ